MSQVLFYCPGCAYSKEISKSDIPPTAKQCKCPSCRKLFNLADAVKPLANTESGTQVIDEMVVGSPQKSAGKEKKLQSQYQELMDQALSKLEGNDDLEAMSLFERAEKIRSTPKARSYLAYCRARIKYEFSDATRVCLQTIKEEPDNAEHYLNLARIYLLANKRGPALRTIRKGLKVNPHPQLKEEFTKFDQRKTPLFASLPRDHLLNRKLGKFFSRCGLR